MPRWMTVSLPLLLAGCAAPSLYDQKTDETLTDLQAKTSKYLDAVVAPKVGAECRHSSKTSQDFWSEAHVQLALVSARVQAAPRGDKMHDAVERVAQSYAGFENVHRLAEERPARYGGAASTLSYCLPRDVVASERDMLVGATSALITLQLMKKQGARQ